MLGGGAVDKREQSRDCISCCFHACWVTWEAAGVCAGQETHTLHGWNWMLWLHVKATPCLGLVLGLFLRGADCMWLVNSLQISLENNIWHHHCAETFPVYTVVQSLLAIACDWVLGDFMKSFPLIFRKYITTNTSPLRNNYIRQFQRLTAKMDMWLVDILFPQVSLCIICNWNEPQQNTNQADNSPFSHC